MYAASTEDNEEEPARGELERFFPHLQEFPAVREPGLSHLPEALPCLSRQQSLRIKSILPQKETNKEIVRLKLAGMGVAIDTLTAEQKKYLASWEIGT